MGISQSYISRLEKRIMARLKKELVRMMEPVSERGNSLTGKAEYCKLEETVQRRLL